MFQMIMRDIKGEKINQLAYPCWQFLDFVLPKAQHGEIRQVTYVVFDVFNTIEAQEQSGERRELVHYVWNHDELVVSEI